MEINADQAAGETSAAGTFGLPGFDLTVVGLAGIFSIAVVPSLNLPLLTPRMALIYLVAVPALACLAVDARRGDRVAQAAAGFVAWSALSAVLSKRPVESLLGGYGTGRGWLVIAASIALWSIGRRLSEDGRRALEVALLIGLGLGAAVTVGQVLADVNRGWLQTVDGRGSGFTDSPVFLGGLMAGGLALAVRRTARNDAWVPWLGAVVLFMLALNLSGARSGLLAALGLSLFELARLLARRGDWKRALAVAAALAVGLALSVPIAGGSSGTGRLEDPNGSGGVTPRAEMWKAAAGATAEHPIFGWGPGRFRAATSTRVTAKFVRAEGQDKLFFDAHNVFVETATTTGLVGLALLLGWLVLVARRSRGNLALLAVGIALTWLAEPTSIFTLPLALLALGASDRQPVRARPIGEAETAGRSVRLARVALAVVSLVALLPIARVVYVDVLVNRGEQGSLRDITRAEDLMPSDPVVADLDAQFQIQAGELGVTPARAAAISAARHTTKLEPERHNWWVTLGNVEGQWGDLDKALVAFRRAEARDPWSEQALAGIAKVGQLSHRPGISARANAKLCLIGSTACRRP